MATKEEKLSFSFASKSSSSSSRSKRPQAFEETLTQAPNPSSSNPQFVTVFDPSQTRLVIPAIPNSDFRHATAKRMNLPLPDTDKEPDSSQQRFVTEELNSNASDNISYGLTVRSNNSDPKSQQKEEVVDLRRKRFREDMESLPDHRGMEEFKEVAVEDFGAAILAGYGWSEGKGIGKNNKGDTKVVQYNRRAGTQGLGYEPKVGDSVVKVKKGREMVYVVNDKNGKVLYMDAESGNCLGWAARDTSGVLSPYRFSRRALGNCDISLRITCCGVCYADVIWTRNKHGDSNYPLVPGHEIVGVVTRIVTDVDRFKVGDHVGVGTYVNPCRECNYCNDNLEVHCLKGPTATFNALDSDGTYTKGGYSSHIVVHERYCYTIPEGYPLAQAAPLLCAGITVYTPMIRHKMNQPGRSLGVIGLGGLGHMAVKFGKAFGLKVTIFSTSASKKEESLNLLGADKFVISSDEKEMQSLANSRDFIIDTASGDHPFDPYMSLLKIGGIVALVGFPS